MAATSFFRNPKLSQFGYDYLKTNVTTGHVCINPLVGDSLAQIQAKSIASSAYATGDVTISTNVNNDLETQVNGKSIDPTATAAGTDDIALVFVSGTEVLISTDIQDRVITNEAGDMVQIPAVTFFSRQLKAVP